MYNVRRDLPERKSQVEIVSPALKLPYTKSLTKIAAGGSILCTTTRLLDCKLNGSGYVSVVEPILKYMFRITVIDFTL